MTPQDFDDPIQYGMTQGALAQLFNRGYEQAQIEMTWYEGDIPEFSVINDYQDFAVTIDNAYWDAHPDEKGNL